MIYEVVSLSKYREPRYQKLSPADRREAILEALAGFCITPFALGSTTPAFYYASSPIAYVAAIMMLAFMALVWGVAWWNWKRTYLVRVPKLPKAILAYRSRPWLPPRY